MHVLYCISFVLCMISYISCRNSKTNDNIYLTRLWLFTATTPNLSDNFLEASFGM